MLEYKIINDRRWKITFIYSQCCYWIMKRNNFPTAIRGWRFVVGWINFFLSAGERNQNETASEWVNKKQRQREFRTHEAAEETFVSAEKRGEFFYCMRRPRMVIKYKINVFRYQSASERGVCVCRHTQKEIRKIYIKYSWKKRGLAAL